MTMAVFLIVDVAFLAVIPLVGMLIAGFAIVITGEGIKKDQVGWVGTILVGATFTLMVVGEMVAGDIATSLQAVIAFLFVVAAAATTVYACHEALAEWFHLADAGQT